MSLPSLPLELILEVIDTIDDQQALLALSRTSHQFRKLINRRLISFNIKHHRGSGLRWAAARNDVAIAQRFLNDPNIDIQATDLDHEFFKQRCDLDPDDEELRKEYRDARDTGRFHTAFWTAMHKKNEEVAVLLLEHGADKEDLNYSQVHTPYTAAALWGCATVLRKLIELGADPLPTRPGSQEVPIIAVITVFDKPKMVAMVLDDLERRYPESLQIQKSLAITCAAIDSSMETLQMLLDRGVPPNAPSPSVDDPLYWAIFQRQSRALRLLLQYGAKLNHDPSQLRYAVNYAWEQGSAVTTFEILWEAWEAISDSDERAQVEEILRAETHRGPNKK